MSAAIHLSGFEHWRDKDGNGFAPCGALIATRDARGPQLSTEDLPRVTCRVCQERAGALGKAYAQARRKKEIPW